MMDNNALIVAEKLDIAVVFSDKGMAKLLDEIKTKVIAHVSDTSSEQGRKDIISLAYKITRSKTLIDDLGKGVVSDWKKKAKLIDEHRKTARDFLDDLKNTARQPLTDWEAEQAIIKEKEEAVAKEKIQKRIDTLFALNVIMPFSDVATMSDEEYSALLNKSQARFEDEQRRIAVEKATMAAEEKKLAEERAEIEKIKIEQEAKAREQAEREASLKAQENAIEDAKRKEIERQEQIAWQAHESERLRILAEADAAEKIEREAREKKEKEVADLAEKARAEALRPDREKIIAWAKSIRAFPIPAVSNEKAQEIVANGLGKFMTIADSIIKRAKEL